MKGGGLFRYFRQRCGGEGKLWESEASVIGASREMGKGEVRWHQTKMRKLTFILGPVGSLWGC